MNIADIFESAAVFCGQMEYSNDIKASKRDGAQYRLQELFQNIYDQLEDGFILAYAKQGELFRSKAWNELFTKDMKDRWCQLYCEQREKKMSKSVVSTNCGHFITRCWMTFILSSGSVSKDSEAIVKRNHFAMTRYESFDLVQSHFNMLLASLQGRPLDRLWNSISTVLTWVLTLIGVFFGV
jgi:hypothetical protein